MKKKLSLFFLLCILFVLLFYLAQDPYAINKQEALEGSNWRHLFGTDYLGRDLFSRILYGSGYSLLVASIALVGVITVSLVIGGLAGYLGGLVDTGMMILADILISIPSLILALVFTGLFSNSILTVMVALMISWSGKYIRYIRNLVLNIGKEEFILLAPLRGSRGAHTIVFHVMPNIFAQLLSLFMTDLGKIMLSISGLAFLGIGAQPPTPELGTILYDGKAYFFTAPWIFIFPGLILVLIILFTQFISSKMNRQWGINND